MNRLIQIFLQKRYHIGLVFLAALFAGAQFHAIQETFGTYDYQKHIEATENIVDGIPAWRVQQCRIMGPYIVEGVHSITGWDFATSYQVITYLMLFAFFLILIYVSRSIFNSTIIALGIVSAAGFLNAFLMQGEWLYIWDYIHLILFTLLIWAVLTCKPLWVICAIILIETFNNELVLIIAGWLLLDAIVVLYGRGWRLPNLYFQIKPQQLILSILLVVGSYLVMDAICTALLICQTTSPNALASLEAWGIIRLGDLVITLPFNLDLMKESFLFTEKASFWAEKFDTNNLIIFNPLILGIPLISAWAMLWGNKVISRIGLLYLMLWGAVFVAGPIYETRLWLPFVPFLALIIPIMYPNKNAYKSQPSE